VHREQSGLKSGALRMTRDVHLACCCLCSRRSLSPHLPQLPSWLRDDRPVACLCTMCETARCVVDVSV